MIFVGIERLGCFDFYEELYDLPENFSDFMLSIERHPKDLFAYWISENSYIC
jgi:hypothetical protein